VSAPIDIRCMKRSDAPDVVKVHLASFEGFFLSFLGDRFLRVYYESICDFRQLGFVARRSSDVVGFVAGIENSFGFYQAVLRYRIHRFAIATLPALLKDPGIAPRLWRALFKRSEGEGERENSATLTSIAIRPDLQRSGLGHELLGRFIEEAAKRRMDRIYLETDAVGNDAVCRFYEKEGFAICREYTTPDRRAMREYSLDIAGGQEK